MKKSRNLTYKALFVLLFIVLLVSFCPGVLYAKIKAADKIIYTRYKSFSTEITVDSIYRNSDMTQCIKMTMHDIMHQIKINGKNRKNNQFKIDLSFVSPYNYPFGGIVRVPVHADISLVSAEKLYPT